MLNRHIISMPDKWEYPWYAAWDLAFHALPLSIVDADFVKSQLGKPGVVVIDSRTPAFFSGAQTGGSTQRPHRTGHITGAANVPYTVTLDADQKLKSPAALTALFTAAGAKPGDTVVTYCHIGQQATAVAGSTAPFTASNALTPAGRTMGSSRTGSSKYISLTMRR